MPKGGRPAKPGGEGKMVRLNPNLVAMARIVASDRGVSMGEYLASVAQDVVRRDYLDTIDRIKKNLGD